MPQNPHRCLIPLMLLLWALLVSGTLRAQQVPNKFQKEFLRSEMEIITQNLIRAWQEERFADLVYKLGTADQQKLISPGDFAYRMVSKDWALSAKQPEKAMINISFFNFVLARATVMLNFTHKLNRTITVSKEYKLLLYAEFAEGKQEWRFNLFELMQIPH